MSKSRDQKPAPVDPHAPVHTQTMSPAKRWTLIGVAVFCLLIFSVTGPMTDVIGNWIQGGPMDYATMELPGGGTATIDWDDYQRALDLHDFAASLDAYLFQVGMRVGFSIYPDDTLEDMLAYAALMKLADHWEVTATAAEVKALLQPFFGGDRNAYEMLWRRYAQRAVDFEASVARAYRIFKVRNLLLQAAVPDESQVLSAWADDYAEMRMEFVQWKPEDFEDAVAALEPDAGELQTFYEEGLNPMQRRELEREEAFAFELAVLSGEALAAGAYDAWATLEEPTPENLANFYQANVYSLYKRPAEAVEADPELSPQLTQEEVGDERLRRDYLLQRATMQLAGELLDLDEEAMQAHLAERGAELRVFAEAVPRSELAGLDEVGTTSLGLLSQGEVGVWQQRAVLTPGGLGYLMRPTERVERKLPELEEIRDEVLALWREKRQGELAQEAAEAFMDALPRAEDAVEGDPVVLDEAAFATAAVAAGAEVQPVDWVSRRPRPTVDPIWDPLGARSSIRNQVGAQLDTLVDGQVLEPLDLRAEGRVVVHLLERRPADPATMWPSERDTARQSAANLAMREFLEQQVSFEAMVRLYGLAKTDALLEQAGS